MKETFEAEAYEVGSTSNPSLAITIPKFFVKQGKVAKGKKYAVTISEVGA